MVKKILSFFVIGVACLSSVEAAKRTKKSCNISANPPTQTTLIVDSNTGRVLHGENIKERIYPASLTKIMTLYLTFEALEKGKLSLHKKLYVSRNAESMRPCKLGVRAGESITVLDAVLALIVKSANDAAVILAENIAGSEKQFAIMMNRKAKELGMKDTFFQNSSGWHDPDQKTTAIDLAKLAIATKENYPKFYPLFSRTSFDFRGKIIRGHNRVTANYKGAEGLKTGYTIPAGFNLVTTASKNNKALVGVVTGSPSASSRDKKMVSLLDKYFGVVPDKKIERKKVVKLVSGIKQKKKISKTQKRRIS